MMYPCGIIKDLLPLYIDDVCNEESRQAVQTHLSECETCRKCYEAMTETDSIDGAKSGDAERVCRTLFISACRTNACTE